MCDTRRILTVDPVHYKVHPLERQKVNVIQIRLRRSGSG
jgi:hypothetical protein